MTEWSSSGGRAFCSAMRSTVCSMPVAEGAGAGDSGAPTTRGATTFSGTVRCATVFEVTTTLLTSLPVRGSDRTTEVIRFGELAGGSAPESAEADNRQPIHIVEQNRMKMFRAPAGRPSEAVTKSNGIISL